MKKIVEILVLYKKPEITWERFFSACSNYVSSLVNVYLKMFNACFVIIENKQRESISVCMRCDTSSLDDVAIIAYVDDYIRKDMERLEK